MKYLLSGLIALSLIYIMEAHADSYRVYNYYNSQGVALAISQAQISRSTNDSATQLGIGVGHFNGRDALSVGLSKGFNDVIYSFSVGREEGETGLGAGVNFRFP